MKVATAAEMRGIDNRAINDFGIPRIVLMENAGCKVARKVEEILGGVQGKTICIFAGKGNNGGDGFVVARHLETRGAKVKVLLYGSKEAVAGDAKVNLDILLKTGADIVEINGVRDLDKVKVVAALADCLVDALFGTGFRGEIKDKLAEVVGIISAAGAPVVAVDIPSGIDADNGAVRGVAVKADHTVTFVLPKPGLLFQPGAAYAGEITVADIGIPQEVVMALAPRQNVITADEVRRILPERKPWLHKGACGRVLVVAGSPGLTGAAALTSFAAVRSGAGLVTLATAEGLQVILASKLTEVMTRALPQTESGSIGGEAIPYISELAAASDVLAIGPGIGREEETALAMREVVINAKCPLIIDADGLNALAGYTDVLLNSEALAVLTPHPGEMSRLTGVTIERINADRLNVARASAAKWGAIVVLKGPGTVVAFPDGEVFINTSGNAGMATGGTGDVLTGIIAGFVAQGLSSHDAAVAGVYIHGLAGDIVAEVFFARK
ncbi:MAG: nnr [Firmicutes bacterium]|nr:nnr [Bacillota bacterium]